MADAVPVVWHGGVVPDGDDDQAPAAAQLLTPSKYRTGHARFRRAPVVQETAPASPVAEEAAREPSMAPRDLITRRDGLGASSSSSFPSSVTGVTVEGSVSNGRALLPAAGGHSAGGGGKRPWSPPMQFASHHSSGLNHNSDGDGSERCRCSNKRKSSSSSSSRARRRIRVPAISSRNADIPPDDYSWRKYGQKPIKGSPYPRWRCNYSASY
ncbi:hypothetical protein ABZP36_024381 [Zizania latifolia]